MGLHERVAKSIVDGEELLFIVREDNSLSLEPDDCRCELSAVRHYFSVKRENVFTKECANIREAQEYCAREYGIEVSEWKEEVFLPYDFHFDYTVSSGGVPQPYPTGFPDRKIVIRVLERDFMKADNEVEKQPVLNICGNREGLKYLAALCLLTADSEQYDDSFHIHLEHQIGFDTNIAATLRAPVYVDVIRSGEFDEFSAEPIHVPFDAVAPPSEKI
jgi:hypothetical protein